MINLTYQVIMRMDGCLGTTSETVLKEFKNPLDAIKFSRQTEREWRESFTSGERGKITVFVRAK